MPSRKVSIPLLIAALVAQPTAAAAQFHNVVVGPTSGRVGYHLSIGMPAYHEFDLPRGNKGGAARGTCNVKGDYPEYQGELPPGIKNHFEEGGFVLFSGTPRQPGTWRGTLTMTHWCRGGPDLNQYRRSIPVVWNIEP